MWNSIPTMFEVVKSRILDMCGQYDRDRISFLLDYNVRGGKEFRYRSYVHILGALGGDTSEENLVAGYTVELLQAAFLMTDDIMDDSRVRRGKPCYYLRRGMGTLRDALFLVAAIRRLLDPERRGCYSVPVLRTCLGQTHDTLRKTRDEYNMSTYTGIAENKTGGYTFYLPSVLGYMSAGRQPPGYLWEFCRTGAVVFQMEDDYLNFQPSRSEKSMNDLEEMKCTWFSCRLALVDDGAVDRYFSQGVVTGKVVGIVGDFFGEYLCAVRELVERLRGMVREEDAEALGIFVRLLEQRIS